MKPKVATTILNEKIAKAMLDANKRNFQIEFRYNEITADAARLIAAWKGTNMFFQTLHSLDAECAQALSQWKGNPPKKKASSLSLCGLEGLDADAAEKLAQWKGFSLSIELPSLSEGTAAGLSQWVGGWMSLTVPALTAPAAEKLARYKGIALNLSGIETLSTETAEALAQCQCEQLILYKFSNAPQEVMDALKKHKCLLLR